MIRLAIYLVGLLLVLVALWVLLTQTGLAGLIPVGIVAVLLVLLLGLGIMRAAGEMHEDHVAHEVVETRQQVGDTEIRRSKLE